MAHKPIQIELSTEAEACLPDVLDMAGDVVSEERSSDANVLWNHAEALREEIFSSTPDSETWEIPHDDVETLVSALEYHIDGLDAHSGPAYSDSDLRRARASILENVRQALIKQLNTTA